MQAQCMGTQAHLHGGLDGQLRHTGKLGQAVAGAKAMVARTGNMVERLLPGMSGSGKSHHQGPAPFCSGVHLNAPSHTHVDPQVRVYKQGLTCDVAEAAFPP